MQLIILVNGEAFWDQSSHNHTNANIPERGFKTQILLFFFLFNI